MTSEFTAQLPVTTVSGYICRLALLLTLHRLATLYERDAGSNSRAHLGDPPDLGWNSGQRAFRENGRLHPKLNLHKLILGAIPPHLIHLYLAAPRSSSVPLRNGKHELTFVNSFVTLSDFLRCTHRPPSHIPCTASSLMQRTLAFLVVNSVQK
ncbi:hypothetical protein V8D89_004924 [Ganoderma adspersum]